MIFQITSTAASATPSTRGIERFRSNLKIFFITWNLGLSQVFRFGRSLKQPRAAKMHDPPPPPPPMPLIGHSRSPPPQVSSSPAIQTKGTSSIVTKDRVGLF